MRNIVLFFVMISSSCIFAQSNSDTLFFEKDKDLFEYAFQNSDLTNNTAGLFLDYMEKPDSILLLLNLLKSIDVKSSFGYRIASIMNHIDLTGNFEPKSLLYPFYDHLYSLDYERKQKIPFMIFDTKLSKLNASARNIVENWSSNNPLPPFQMSDFDTVNYFFATPFLDSIVYDNVVLHLDPTKIRSNRSREITNINITVSNQVYTLNLGDELYLSQFNGSNVFSFEYHFNDGSVETMSQTLTVISKLSIPKDDGWPHIDSLIYTVYGASILERSELTIDDDYSNINISNPSIKYLITDGCNDGLLKKPFFLIAGWGPHTDSATINDAQGWPSTVGDFIQSSNKAGFIENLVAAGYDIVFVKFFPPNASIHKNSALLEKMINYVNTRKMNDGSYEENIILGYSAGALCVKFTLQRMEKHHLEYQTPHPHTKLFVSFDGENQGANIPLGVQHMVDFLDIYEQNYNILNLSIYTDSAGAITELKNSLGIYALKYIIDAPLSKELLHYHYTATGRSLSTASQGHSPLRTAYLEQQNLKDHSMNTHIPGYPSFCRNISISNGLSIPNIDKNTTPITSYHFPYPNESQAIIFKRYSGSKRYLSNFLTHGTSHVFYYSKNGFFNNNWTVKYEAITKNPLVLDNAPGGIIFIKQNPLVEVNKIMDFETGSSTPDFKNNHLFCFTPTVFTHDIKNFDAFANGGLGYMDYNFKTQGLNYDNEYDALPSIDNPSNIIGYPHLGHPSNHYSITPFDALFTWDKNTVHIGSGVRSQTHVGDYYIEVPSPARGLIKNFIVEEGEHWNIMLQNKDIGASTNGNITYRVDYNADHDIWFGEHVTQKTDFKPVTIVDNTIVESMAGNAIYIKNGFHAKPGCEWHAFIGVESCATGGGKSLNQGSSNDQTENSFTSTFEVVKKALLIPNPTTNELKINLINNIEREQFNFYIYNFNGILVQQGSAIEKNKIILNLDKGIYIVKIKTQETWYTEKLIIK